MVDDPLNRNKVLRGSQLTHSKLDENDVRNIRELIAYRENLKSEASALSNRKIAEKFGVHNRTIDRIASGENWGHV